MTTVAVPTQTGTRACPKCGHLSEAAVHECPKCHVIIDKAIKAEVAAAEERESPSEGWGGMLASAERLCVKQQVERLEAWTGIETANSYAVKSDLGAVVFHVVEESGSMGDFLVRNYLKSARPFTMRVETLHGETALVLRRPFRWFFSEVEVSDALGRRIGSVQRQFALVNSLYKVTGRRPGETYEIFGPIFRPWTFKIRRHGSECGLISKRWSGMTKEVFTDADTFGIEFPKGISSELKAVFLGAVFLIDFAHFEDNNRS
jgi:hypothetical protein